MQHNPYAVGAFIGVGLGLLFIVYQSLVVIPQNKIDQEIHQTNLKLEAAKLAEVVKNDNYKSCIDRSYKAYSFEWDSQCVLIGESSDCPLKAYHYKEIENRHTANQSTCLIIYTAK